MRGIKCCMPATITMIHLILRHVGLFSYLILVNPTQTVATGAEAAGLAFAPLPLLVKQIDSYTRGIEKISRLRRYRRELSHYSTLFGAQHAILLSTLENVLRDIVQDEKEVSELIRDPNGKGWKDPTLQERLRIKLGRSYEPFLGIMASLFDLVNRVATKMGISITDMKVRYHLSS